MPLQKEKNEHYTYADYLTWPDEERWEIIEGAAYDMTPAPSTRHQEISANFVIETGSMLRGLQCKIFAAPFDVRFPKDSASVNDREIDSVVQPDISIICDELKLDEKGCLGAPDLIIEILSKSAIKDFNIKFKLYEKHQVKEYWIVSPEEQEVSVYKHENNRYELQRIYEKDETIIFGIDKSFKIDLNSIFLP